MNDYDYTVASTPLSMNVYWLSRQVYVVYSGYCERICDSLWFCFKRVDVEDLDPSLQSTGKTDNFNLQHKLDLRLEAEQSDQRARYTVQYEVGSKANSGPRDLRIQFGSTVLQKLNAVVVSD